MRRLRHARDTGRHDAGSALIMVLLMVVIGAFMIVPLLTYSVSVMRANGVVSQRTARSEAVKGGFRLAMSEPTDLYEHCNSADAAGGLELEVLALDVPTTTRCYFLDETTAEAESALPYPQFETWAGSSSPAGITGTWAGPADPAAWLATGTSPHATVDREADQVWLPDLPQAGFAVRSASGYSVPAEQVVEPYTSCTVYFPGSYADPVVINGPTYFASGVYYFTNTVTVVGGADVVVGMGASAGCADDQIAAFHASGAPAEHQISGLGATFVLGNGGRLLVNDSAGVVKFVMNQRYPDSDADPSAAGSGVSIMSVNGDLDDVLAVSDFANAGTDLSIPQRLSAPLSSVADDPAVTPAAEAPAAGYTPSVVTPHPPEPYPPTSVTAAGRRIGGLNYVAAVRWAAPYNPTGYPITGYTVTASPGGATCASTVVLGCVVQGLTNGTSYSFTVRATNAYGTSGPSSPVTASAGGTPLAVPGAPQNVHLENYVNVLGLIYVTPYIDAIVVNWNPPASDGGAPIVRYDVSVPLAASVFLLGSVNLGTATCSTTGTTSCVLALPTGNIVSLNLLNTLLGVLSTGLRVTVTATNAVGVSTSSTVLVGLNLLGSNYVAPVVPPVVYTPVPVIDVTATGANATASIVNIPGYVSVPQGIVRATVADPSEADIFLTGGMLAAWIDADAACIANCVIDLVNPVAQRVIRVVTEADDGSHIVSDAVVQVNSNGAWAVNSWEIQSG